METMRSEDISAIATALAKAQMNFKHPPKTHTVKTAKFTYKYADLAETIDAVRPALNANGICILQTPRLEDGGMSILTMLVHESGQWIAGEYPLPVGATAQEMGSAITYGRRYSLAAVCGVAAEDDDDGAAAEDGGAVASLPAPAAKLDMEAQMKFESAVDGLLDRVRAVSDLDTADDLLRDHLAKFAVDRVGELTEKKMQVRFYKTLEEWVIELEGGAS